MNLLRVFAWLWGINFVAFAIISLLIGGDAWNGHVIHGHYFLGEKGKFTEVSRAVFEYSWWHVLSLIITLPIGILGGSSLAAAERDRLTASRERRMFDLRRKMSKD